MRHTWVKADDFTKADDPILWQDIFLFRKVTFGKRIWSRDSIDENSL